MGVFRDAMEQALALRGMAPKRCSAYLSWCDGWSDSVGSSPISSRPSTCEHSCCT